MHALLAYNWTVEDLMRITFDPDKDEANVSKHGLRLVFGERVIETAVTTMLDTRFEYGEERFVSFGYVERRLYVCVYTAATRK